MKNLHLVLLCALLGTAPFTDLHAAETTPKAAKSDKKAAPLAPVDEVAPLPATIASEPAPAPAPKALPAPNPKFDKVLLEAIGRGDGVAVQSALMSGANANIADKSGTAALSLAAAAGQTEAVQALLLMGAKVDATDKQGRTALHQATQIGVPKPKKKKGFGGLGKMLGGNLLGGIGGGAVDGLAGGLGGDLQNQLLGALPLDSLLQGNLKGLLGGNFDLGAKSGWSAILGTALQGDLKTGGQSGIAGLLGSGAKLDARGWTSLLSKVQSTNPQVLAAMGRLGGAGAAAANGANPLWGQFLTQAASGNEAGVAELLQNPELQPLLAQAGAGLEAASGDLPGVAARNIVELLLAAGANPLALDEKGQSAASLASARGWAEVAKMLTPTMK